MSAGVRRPAAQPAPPAIILAAGVGRRLAPLTETRPKALIEVGGLTLLERALRALAMAGFERALVVTGHHAAMVDQFLAERSWQLSVTTRFNERYAEANNIVTFTCAADWMGDGFCLLNSDIVFDPSLAADMALTASSHLVVDADEPLGDEEMKVALDGPGGRVVGLNKGLPVADAVGEYIGLARFDGGDAAVVLASARDLLAAGRDDLYYEDAIAAASAAVDLRISETGGRLWTEIDDHVDLARAEQIALAIDRQRRDRP